MVAAAAVVDEDSADDISFSCTNYKKVGINKGTGLTQARGSPSLFMYSLGVSLFYDILIHQNTLKVFEVGSDVILLRQTKI